MNQGKKPQTSPIGSLEYSHPLEKWVERDWVRLAMGWLSTDRPGSAQPHLLRALMTYGVRKAPVHEKLLYWPVHKIIDRLAGSKNREQLGSKLAGHPPTQGRIVFHRRETGCNFHRSEPIHHQAIDFGEAGTA